MGWEMHVGGDLLIWQGEELTIVTKVAKITRVDVNIKGKIKDKMIGIIKLTKLINLQCILELEDRR